MTTELRASRFGAVRELAPIWFAGERFDGSALEALARAHAARLARLGVVAGDRVAVMAETGPRLLAAVVAHLRLGVVHVPVNTRYRAEEVEYIVADAGAKVCLRALEADPAPSEFSWPEAPSGDALALIVYTSGTTARPKGVVWRHDALARNLAAVMALWEVTADDVVSLALPLFHVHGLGLGVLGAWLLGGAAVRLHRRFEPALLANDCRAGATLFMGVPTMYHNLVAHFAAVPADAEACRAARLFTAGSAALSAALFEGFRAHTGHAILERYGMTETGFTLSNPYRGERRRGSVGRPVPGIAVRLVDDDGRAIEGDDEPGEIWVAGDALMSEYWQARDATTAAFASADGGRWFRTGDVATRDADGYFHIVGRRSTDIVKSGGFKIGTREIEDVLATDPRVREVAVVGVPDPKWGEALLAVVALADGVVVESDATFLEELRVLVAGHLADFKRPRALRIVDALPRNALGKVQKSLLVG